MDRPDWFSEMAESIITGKQPYFTALPPVPMIPFAQSCAIVILALVIVMLKAGRTVETTLVPAEPSLLVKISITLSLVLEPLKRVLVLVSIESLVPA